MKSVNGATSVLPMSCLTCSVDAMEYFKMYHNQREEFPQGMRGCLHSGKPRSVIRHLIGLIEESRDDFSQYRKSAREDACL